MTKGFVIAVEGIIGAGKSCFSKALADVLGFSFVDEPPPEENPFLARFYDQISGRAEKAAQSAFRQEMRRLLSEAKRKNLTSSAVLRQAEEIFLYHARSIPRGLPFILQVYLLNERLAQQEEALKQRDKEGRGTVLARTATGDLAFHQLLFEGGHLTRNEMEALQKLWERSLRGAGRFDLVIWLSVKPYRALMRIIQKRGRDFESDIPIEYLQGLERAYKEKVLPQFQQNGCPVMEIDWNRNYPTDEAGQLKKFPQEVLARIFLRLADEQKARERGV